MVDGDSTTGNGQPEVEQEDLLLLEYNRIKAEIDRRGPLRRAVDGIRAAFQFAVGGFLLHVPGWNAGITGYAIRSVLFIVRYAATWVAVAWLIWQINPALLVGSREGMQTALQVLPATLVAVFVLLVGSVAVIAQMAAQTWGTRAPLLLTIDDAFQFTIYRPLLLLVATLLLAGQVPDSGSPHDLATAAVGALLLATAVVAIRSTVLPVTVIQSIQPRSFPLFVLRDVGRELLGGKTGLVVLRGPLLGEMLKMSLRREDSISVTSTLEAIIRFQNLYLYALAVNDDIRTHPSEGSERDDWFTNDMTGALVRAGEQALGDQVPASDANAISRVLGTLAENFIRWREADDASRPVAGLIDLGTSAHQIARSGAFNFHGPPVEVLSHIEAVAEEEGQDELAAYALAGWALVAAYPEYHFEGFGIKRHPLWATGIRNLGPSPDWDEAKAIVASPEWQSVWGNKQYEGPKPVQKVLDRARKSMRADREVSPSREG